MTKRRHSILCAACAGLTAWTMALLSPAPARAQDPPTSAPATATPVPLGWDTAYDAAANSARQSGKPLLVIFGATWCEACHELNDQLRSPEVQQELGDIGRVYVDFDANHDLAHKMGVGPIPALRVVTPSGRTVGVHDGSMPAQELAAWLRDVKKSAAQTAYDTAFDADDLPDAAIAKLVELLGDADTAMRETAVRRLLAHRDKAAVPVAEAFAKGGLAQRITALDLLDSWHAPIEKMDPWRPDSLTDDRLAALKKWAEAPATAETSPALDEKQRAEARDLLQRYLNAHDDETPALRERLARYGTGLLPDIYAALKDASADQTRERLTFLRYRVAASDSLALQWPVGIERLASAQVKVRHSALDELSNRVTARDSGLLLELFSDSDALVRETALSLLQKVGGPSAMDALANLLHDPDPNVRAAVLKSVAESPTAQITAKVADFALQETDTDLVVHAIRVLRNAKGAAAIKTLYTLLDNASWRVRAEAIEALTEKAGGRSEATPQQQADFLVKMMDMLSDADGFVASRALSALENSETLPNVQKIAEAADKHPELAAMAIKIISNNIKTDPKGPTYIRGFVAHKDPIVRATTIGSLLEVLGPDAADDAHRALGDTEERVRTAVTDALLSKLLELSPENKDDPFNQKVVDHEKFLTDFQAGKGRPKWLDEFRPDLEKLLNASSKQEQLHAAIPLVALGYKDKALPLIRKLASDDPSLIDTASPVLVWLGFDERLELFNAFRAAAKPGSLPRLVAGLAVGEDPRAADTLWDLLADPKADWTEADMVDTYLRQMLIGESFREPTVARKQEIAKSLSKHLNAGGDIPRTLALVMLADVDSLAGTDAARKIRDDPAASESLKRDALQIQLALLPHGDAEAAAAGMLTQEDSPTRTLLLDILTGNESALRYIHGQIYVPGNSRFESYNSGTPIIPLPPKGLTVEQIKPLLTDKNPLVAAEAGYLLALLKDRSGLQTLIDYYHKNSSDHDFVCRLVFRAVSALDDDTMTPTLKEIYKTLAKSDSYLLREFYWTIRSMTGDQCIELRKHIRDEVGMEALR